MFLGYNVLNEVVEDVNEDVDVVVDDVDMGVVDEWAGNEREALRALAR